MGNFSYFFIGLIFGVIPLIITIILHPRTFKTYWKIIILINLVLLIPTLAVNRIGYNLGLYAVSSHKTFGISLFQVPLEDIFFAIVFGLILPLITIIMFKAYKNNKTFREIFFKKDGEW